MPKQRTSKQIVGVYIEDDVAEELRKRAAEDNRSLSNYIALLIYRDLSTVRPNAIK